MTDEPADCIVIGAGQSGLAAAYELSNAGLRFVVLEAGPEPVGSWPAYYDSLRLFSSRRYSSLPGLAFPGRPDRFPVRDEVAEYLRGYARHFAFPVRTGATVDSVRRDGDGFRVDDRAGRAWHARSVIVATGAHTTPNRPSPPGLEDFGGRVMHSAEYRNPEPFAGARVVVVGGGNSGVQIAAELDRSADVTLATRGRLRITPHRILGRDVQFWTKWTGLERCPWLGGSRYPVVDTGGYIESLRAGRPPLRPVFTRMTPRGVVWPGGAEEPVDAVIFATGFRESFPFLGSMPGAERHRRGVSRSIDGLYFLGRPGQNGLASGTLRGAGRDARFVVERLRRRLGRARSYA
jgi:putative flavoprotein involved in K+ transport